MIIGWGSADYPRLQPLRAGPHRDQGIAPHPTGAIPWSSGDVQGGDGAALPALHPRTRVTRRGWCCAARPASPARRVTAGGGWRSCIRSSA